MPKSPSRSAAMTSWSVSRFLPMTRSCSPWVWDWMPLMPRPLMNLLSSRALSDEMPAARVMVWRARAPDGLLDLARVEDLHADLALDQLLLEHLAERVQPVLARRLERDRVLARQLDRLLGVLEVVAGRRLAGGLVHGVADLLEVELGDDVEARHGPETLRDRGRSSWKWVADGHAATLPASWVGARVAKGNRL